MTSARAYNAAVEVHIRFRSVGVGRAAAIVRGRCEVSARGSQLKKKAIARPSNSEGKCEPP